MTRIERQREIERQNRMILDMLAQKPRTRPEIIKKLPLPRTTLFGRLRKLQEDALIETFSDKRTTKGRPFVFFKLSETA